MNLSTVFKALKKFNAYEPIYIYNNKVVLSSVKGFVIVHNTYDAPEGCYNPTATSDVIRGYSPAPTTLYGEDIDALESIIGYNNNVMDKLTVFNPRIFVRVGGSNALSENIVICDGEITTASDSYIVSTQCECPQANNANGLYSTANAMVMQELDMDVLEAKILANSLVVSACDLHGNVWDIELAKNTRSSYTTAIERINRIWSVYDTEKMATVYGACEIFRQLKQEKFDTYEAWCESRPTYAYLIKVSDQLLLRIGESTRTSEVLFEASLDADLTRHFLDIKMPLYLFIEMIADATPEAVIEIPKQFTEPMIVKDRGYSKGGMFTRKW